MFFVCTVEELSLYEQATGWNEYLTCPSTPLWKFGHVYASLRDMKPVQLTLMQIRDGECAHRVLACTWHG